VPRTGVSGPGGGSAIGRASHSVRRVRGSVWIHREAACREHPPPPPCLDKHHQAVPLGLDERSDRHAVALAVYGRLRAEGAKRRRAAGAEAVEFLVHEPDGAAAEMTMTIDDVHDLSMIYARTR
jgi:hypothetical protein